MRVGYIGLFILYHSLFPLPLWATAGGLSPWLNIVSGSLIQQLFPDLDRWNLKVALLLIKTSNALPTVAAVKLQEFISLIKPCQKPENKQSDIACVTPAKDKFITDIGYRNPLVVLHLEFLNHIWVSIEDDQSWKFCRAWLGAYSVLAYSRGLILPNAIGIVALYSWVRLYHIIYRK